MMKKYEAPCLFVDSYAADSAIADSTGGGGEIAVNPKNGNAGNNQNCFGCDAYAFADDGYGNSCIFYPGNSYEDAGCA